MLSNTSSCSGSNNQHQSAHANNSHNNNITKLLNGGTLKNEEQGKIYFIYSTCLERTALKIDRLDI